ncbi:MAG: TatD family hydrolase [Acidimicrobiales bacterium]
MSGGWFDSHCHLQGTYRSGDTGEEEALAAASAAGVTGLVCIGTDAATSAEALAVVARARVSAAAGVHGVETWATVGLHPHDASAGVDGITGVLEEALASSPGVVVAVGECGFDLHYEHSPRHAQREAFAAQIELARRHDLTLVVHSRSAWDETLELLAADPLPRVVLHCFTGGPDEARRCLDLGAYLSFSGIVTFKNAQDIRDALALCPLDRLLVETDAPFLAPVPHRGKPNQPAWVSVVGEAVASLRSKTPEALAQSTADNARAAFALR